MGLPLFITPVEPNVATKASEKPTTVPRSSIRRQRTVRGPQARLLVETRRRRMLSMLDSNYEDYEVWENQQRSPPTDIEDSTVASSHARAQRLLEEGRATLRRYSPSFERQHVASSEEQDPLMPPVPEPGDYAALVGRHRDLQRLHQVRQDLRRLARRNAAPTPPYTETEASSNTPPNQDDSRPSSLTPAISSIHQSIVDGAGSEMRHPSAARPTAESPWVFDQPARPSMMDELPPLRRLGHRSTADVIRMRRLRQARLDGLGDRDRSLSPEGDAAWDTLLTSITPDPQPPSAGSSFASTSAAAAASASSGSIPTSTSTSMTNIRTTDDPSTIQPCEASDSGSDTEGEEEEDIYELQDSPRTTGDRFWRTYADVVTARADHVALHGGAGDTEHLGGMQRIILRLSQRNDIPDEWWAGAGVSRALHRDSSS
jgi:hypothetical protein